MRAPVRLLIALLTAAILEVGFFFISKSVIKPPKREVKRVIKISLLKPEKKTVVVRKEIGQPTKKRTPLPSPKSKPKLKSKKPRKQPIKKQRKEQKRTKPRKPGGLKPLQGNLPLSYLEAVKSAIEENIFYPLEAIERGEEGIVEVKFTINREGRVLTCKPIKGESHILREATCMAIKRAKFPPIPESVKNDSLSFQLEIEYDLKKAFGGT
jgi:protein TonB